MLKQVWHAPDGQCFDTEEECIRYEGQNGILRLFYDDQGQLRQTKEEVEIRKQQLALRINEAFGRNSYGLKSTIEWLFVAAKDEHTLLRNAP